MKQVVQRLRDGHVEVLDVPPPVLTPGGVLVDVRASILSAGTERAKVQAGRQSLVGKARSRPDQVQQVLDKARRDGIRETAAAVRARLNEPSVLGYSAAGVVLAVGSAVRDIHVGDSVACAGGDHAVHAEIDHVPFNLCVRMPDGVSFEQGAFGTIGSIALHGLRQADVHLGDRVGVIGLGLVGQLTAQLAKAAGCQVFGFDLSPDLVELARSSGAVDDGFVRRELASNGLPAGASDCDAVIITAATRSSDPVEFAAELCRDRGRVVVVGTVGMDIPRAPFYAKELELRLSRSYGPGRYDREYEERGLDYPVGYVRWTERRNIAAFLDLVAAGTVSVEPLITQRAPVEEAPQAYERLMDAGTSPLGIVLEYRESAMPKARGPRPVHDGGAVPVSPGAEMNAGVIGAGSFAQRVLMPGLKKANFTLTAVASGNGLSARAAADRFGFANAVAVEDLIHDPSVGVLVIATRHGSHARLSVEGLMAGKLVFVEKPPCLTVEELADLQGAVAAAPHPLIVGFNRRHAPAAQVLRDHAARRNGPLELLYRVNAGTLEPGHWLNDPEDGGGRLIGEGCHFVDFASWAVGAVPARVMCMVRGGQGFTIAMEFSDGSLATVFYETGGATALPKERIEAHADGGTVVVDDFRTVEVHEGRKVRRPRVRTGKGHTEQFLHLAAVAQHQQTPLPPDPLDTMAATLAAAESAATGCTVSPDEMLAAGPTVVAPTSSHTEVN